MKIRLLKSQGTGARGVTLLSLCLLFTLIKAADIQLNIKVKPGMDKYYIHVSRDGKKYIRSLVVFTNTDIYIGNCISGTYRYFIVGEDKNGILLPDYNNIVTNITLLPTKPNHYIVIQGARNYELLDLTPFYAESALEMGDTYPPIPNERRGTSTPVPIPNGTNITYNGPCPTITGQAIVDGTNVIKNVKILDVKEQ